MDELWKTIVDAHNELMEAVGMSDLSSRVTEAMTTGPGVFDGLRAFIDAVDWTEPFFLYLGAFHATLIGMSIGLAWGSATRTCALMCVLLALSMSSGTLNSLGRENFKSLFVDQKTNYFDERGVFISAVFGGPIIALAFVLQIKMFLDLVRMMIVVKRGKLREDAKNNNSASNRNSKVTADSKKTQ